MSSKRTSWLQDYRSDFQRYREYRSEASTLNLLITEQGLWALLHYRITHSIYRSNAPNFIKNPLLAILLLWHKAVEITTGISVSYKAKIARGFYIGHFGNIFIGHEVEIGEMCNISQGVTLGVTGEGESRGMPRLGNRVYIATNAVVAGKIVIGDDACIAANSLVGSNVLPGAVMMGVPARLVMRYAAQAPGEPPCPDQPLCSKASVSI